ncbi:MAG: hypothetical protein J6D19_10190, partial [Clostridia bacterium]|nr:hypothetical protein [Clostridia bacterium]
MLFSDYRFTLDLHKTQSQISIPVTLGDTARKLYISFSVRGVPYVIKDGCRAVFSAKKADGTTLFNDCIIEDNMTVRYDFTANTATAEGITDCRILLYGANGRLLATPRFIMVVDKKVVYDDEIAVSDSERTSIDNMMLAETVRVNAEAERVASEMARTTAENDRVSAESVRAEAESQRLSEEKDRQTSEKERSAAETARVSAEKTRVDNETTRVSAENQRNSNEQTRTASETGRIDAEKKRVSAEDLRIESETTRVQSEALRKSAEILRNQNESKRESNEEARISAEADRVNNEKTRVDNENIRIENERTRQALHEEMKTFFDGVENVLTNKNVAQELGDDPEKVLSQKAATDTTHAIIKGADISNEAAQFIIKENENLHNPHTDCAEYLMNNGTTTSLEAYKSTNFIKVYGIDKLYIYTDNSKHYIGPFCLYYNVKKELIGFLKGASPDYVVSDGKYEIPIHTDAVYVRFNIHKETKYSIYTTDIGEYKDYKAHIASYLIEEFVNQRVEKETEEIIKPFVRESIKNIGVKEQNCYAKIIDGKNAFISTERDNDTNYYLGIGDPEKFCVKENKYFQSDETQSMRKNLKGSIFYG